MEILLRKNKMNNIDYGIEYLFNKYGQLSINNIVYSKVINKKEPQND